MRKPEPMEAVHVLNIIRITVDEEVQSRCGTKIEYVHYFSECIERGDVLKPIVVYREGNKHWLSQGFHRYKAHIKSGKTTIRAHVREGGKREAMIDSAGSNKECTVPVTKEDIRKSARMLFSDPEWWGKANPVIGNKVGVSSAFIGRLRNEYHIENGISLPVLVERSDGKKRPFRNGLVRPKIHQRKNGTCFIFVGGEKTYLGRNPEEAEIKADKVYDDHNYRSRTNSSILCDLSQWMLRNGIACEPANQGVNFGRAVISQGILITPLDFSKGGSVLEAVGTLVINRCKHGADIGLAIVCDVILDNEVVTVARELGIEFHNPETLLAKLQGRTEKEGVE